MIEKCYIAPVQKKCNCSCTFCISKVRNYDKTEEFLIPDNVFENNVKLLKQRGIKKIEITGGGEPLLNSNIRQIISTIKRHIPDSYIKLYTNGNILLKIDGIDELNISVVHYDTNINNHFMNPAKGIDILTKLKFFKENMPQTKIRLSIPLLKGGIDTKEKLEEFIKLTDKYVSEYVVRTLYPKTKNKDEIYVDFPFEHPKVIFERDNDVTDFNGLIMWSDNKVYSDWNLNKEVNLDLGYILLKPDSQTYIEKIEQLILLREFIIFRKYLLDDFVNQAINLYEDKKSDLGYYQKVKRHLESAAYLFGNNGLVMLLGKNRPPENLFEDIYNLKLEIRKRYSFTGSREGYIKTGDNISHLNMVHAPDPLVSLYQRDIRLLDEKGILNKEIDNDNWQLIKKHSSFGGIK